ncbi:MAG: hypothetical protein HFE39_03845 [Clostridiales bacterium]|jgi:hypothetical protein|nr:hypothetical protein [Clostridiales bacterium]
MLTILPEKNPAVCAEVWNRCGAEGKDPAVLCARSGEECLGYVAVDIWNQRLRILEFVLTGKALDQLDGEDKDLADSMIKAAASYGMNRNVFQAESGQVSLFPLLAQFGFQQIDNKMTIDFTQLIRKCKKY